MIIEADGEQQMGKERLTRKGIPSQDRNQRV